MDIKKELSYSKINLIVLVAMFSQPSRMIQSWTKDFFPLFFLERSGSQREHLNPQSLKSPGYLVKQMSKHQG